ncbi:DNA-binding protein [Paenibacillus pinihumi]|uniref:DNA-binding protein n=1 Tax=Paenibacillus pinihumi TaxID=669462 RepID=UPI0003F69C5A|nr:DNA-binding protein [Paenibacillus pinihumi]
MIPVTKEEIFEAADAMAAEGKTPRIEGIREALGTRGSFSTIKKYLNEWKEQVGQLEESRAIIVPQAITDRLQQFGTVLWSAAVELAAEGVRVEREELAKAKNDMEEEQRETVAFADTLSKEADLLRQKILELEGALVAEKSAHDSTRSMLAIEKDERARLSVAYDSALERLEDFKSSSSRYENMYYKSEEANKKLLKAEAEREGRIARLEGEVENVQAEMKNQVAMLVHELDNERDKLHKAEQSSVADRAAAQEAKIESAKLQGKLEALQKGKEK